MAESPSDQVFWYRAPAKIPKFTIGLPVYQRLEAKRQQKLKEAENDPNRPVFVPATDTGTDKLRRALVDAI
eukprot:4213617-Prymnesium_polylepis.1